MSLFSKGSKKFVTSPCISATWAFSESMISLSTTFLNVWISAGARIGDVVADPVVSTKISTTYITIIPLIMLELMKSLLINFITYYSLINIISLEYSRWFIVM